MSPLGNNIGRNLLQEAPRQEDAPTALALGQRARQFEPGLAAAGRIVRQIGELGREQERGLGKAQAGRDQQLGEERVAGAVAVSGAGPLGAVDVEATKSDITKYAVVFKGHEADVGSLGGALIGIVPRSNASPPVPISSPPHLAMGERAGPDQAFQLRPSVKLLERSDATVPGRGGDTRTSIFAPPCTMKRIDIHARSRPDRLAAGGVQKSNPHCDVIAVGAQRVGRANAVERQVKEETVEGGVVRDAVAENDRNVAVETFRRSALLDRDNGRRRQRKVIHGLCSPLPPDLPTWANRHLPRAPLRRSWGHCASRAGPSCSLRGQVLRAQWRTGADCPDKARISSREYAVSPKRPVRSRFRRWGAPE